MTQYGLRLMNKDLESLSWLEFKCLLAGLLEDTPLAKIIRIRKEEDKEVLKTFTKEQWAIRNAYRLKMSKSMKKEDYSSVLDDIKNALINMTGGSYGG